MDLPTFSQHVREALAHLYDRPYLQSHPLARLLSGMTEALSGEALHRLLIDAVQQLRPPESAPPTSPCLRRYRCLVLRYSHGATPEAVARELGVSPRQARRDHFEAVNELAAVLWKRYCRLEEARERAKELLEDTEQEALVGEPVETSLEAELIKLGSGRRGGPVSLEDTLRDALAIVGKLATTRRVCLESAVPQALPPIALDRIILRQALLNLLSYAIELCGDGRVYLSAEESAECVNLGVRIPRERREPATRKKVAEAAVQAEALLAASRRLVEAQGGTLQVSIAADGSYQVTLGLATQPGTTVLVVDDNPDVARLFRRFLRGSNYRLLHASTGRKALQLAREAHPDVITLDLLMPSQDGWDILRQLKAHRETKSIPVIVCSILPHRELAVSVGAADFLAKPVTQAGLIAALEALIELTRAAANRDKP